MISQKPIAGMNGGKDGGTHGSMARPINPAIVLSTIGLALAAIALAAPQGKALEITPITGTIRTAVHPPTEGVEPRPTSTKDGRKRYQPPKVGGPATTKGTGTR
jgi:hypothetical protein